MGEVEEGREVLGEGKEESYKRERERELYFTFVWAERRLVTMATSRSSDRLPPSRPRGSASPESQSWSEINIDDGRIDQSEAERLSLCWVAAESRGKKAIEFLNKRKTPCLLPFI